MSVPKSKRRDSKVEFDNNYFKIYNDCILLIMNKFGAKGDIAQKYEVYIKAMALDTLKTINEIGRQIRIANSIFPTCDIEYQERRLSQDKAIGLCYDLLTKYQIIMNILRVSDNKYVGEIEHIIHEINCLKSWRTSDNKRFKNIG